LRLIKKFSIFVFNNFCSFEETACEQLNMTDNIITERYLIIISDNVKLLNQ